MTMTTKLDELKRDLNYMTRTVNQMLTDDYEAVEVMHRTIANMRASISEIELDAQPDTSDALIAA
jgi:hypothetical protein